MHIVTNVMKIGPTVKELRSLGEGGNMDIAKVIISKKAVEELFGGKTPPPLEGVPFEIGATSPNQARIILGEKLEEVSR